MTIQMRSSCSSFVTAAASALAFVALACVPQPAAAQFTQQGNKFVATGFIITPRVGATASLSGDGNIAYLGAPHDNGGVGSSWIFNRSAGVYTQDGVAVVGIAAGGAHQGTGVGLSADGSTAILGGSSYNVMGTGGAAWMFARSGITWTQQGGTMIGTGAIGNAAQGTSVALSADGNTAIVGGPGDNAGVGAAWIFTRTGTTWSQQQKLVGSSPSGASQQGVSVAISADGNTVAMGGDMDNANIGAVWIFTRSGGTWTQQGAKLVGTGNTGVSLQGVSVALSGDSNTLAVGGSSDNAGIGAAWIFTRSGSTWTQQGGKLVPQGNVGSSGFGFSVSLSHDGSLALFGGPLDNSSAGAAWAFARTGGAWGQLGSKLVGTGAVGAATQGFSVALSTDGTTAISGGPADNGDTGAAWAFTQPPSTLLAAVLPASRSSTIGSVATGTVTAFATIINTGTVAATDCGIAPNASLPAAFAYQTTNPSTNALTGTVNTGSAIAANNGMQTYVFGFTPSAPISPTNVPFFFSCINATPAPSVVGLNTLLLSASTTPTPDVVALGATLQNDGVVHVTNGSPPTGVFAVATSNLGSTDNITVGTNTGATSLPITVTICQTNPGTGACLQTAGPTVTTTIAGNGTPTFGIFVTASGTVAFSPAVNRIFVTFTDSTSNIRGETSVAVATQ
jgi:hypothetical protein